MLIPIVMFSEQTLVQVPDLFKLQGLVDRLKNVGEQLDVGVTQYGDLHLNVTTTSVKIGSEFRKLRVVGVSGKNMFFCAASVNHRDAR